jgi:type IV secretion system protein VirB10
MSDTDDQMSPDASPGEVGKKSGVRRVNNMPMYLIGGVMGLFLLVMAMVAADRAAQQNAPAEGPKEKAGNSAMFAKEIAGERTSGMIEPAKALVVPEEGGTVPPAGEPVKIAKADVDTPPVPQGNNGVGGPRPTNQPQDDEAQRIRQAKLQQLDEAVKAKSTVQMVAPRTANAGRTGGTGTGSRAEILARIAEVRQQADAQTAGDPTAAYQARLAAARAVAGGGEGQGGGSGEGQGQGQLMRTAATTSGYSQFGANPTVDRWKLDSKPDAPRSAFELRAGFVIPATLISGINSDLPGQIMAQVSQNVYDTPTGKHLLVPLGSRLVGSYSSEVKYGQARVLVAWQRIVFPDGKAMDIGAMPGADGAGYAGFTDQVNNHLVRLFGSAFLMSGVTAGITYSQRQGQTAGIYGTPSASSALSEALGQQLGQVTAQLIAKNLSISPTLEIRPGYRFNVVVTKDLTFSKPYHAFDY